MMEFRKPLLSLDDRKLKGKINSIDVDIDRQEVQVRIQHIAGQLISCQEISLQYNFITSFGALAFDGFGSLKELYLGGNELTSIPSLEHLPQLSALHLNNNKINSVGDISYLKALTTFNLRANCITDVSLFRCSPSLRHLSLSCNKIILGPSSLLHLPNLIFLSLFGNCFNSLAELLQVFSSAPNVQVDWPTLF